MYEINGDFLESPNPPGVTLQNYWEFVSYLFWTNSLKICQKPRADPGFVGSEDNTNFRALGMERFPWESCQDGRESRVKTAPLSGHKTPLVLGSAQSHGEMKVRPRKWGEEELQEEGTPFPLEVYAFNLPCPAVSPLSLQKISLPATE